MTKMPVGQTHDKTGNITDIIMPPTT